MAVIADVTSACIGIYRILQTVRNMRPHIGSGLHLKWWLTIILFTNIHSCGDVFLVVVCRRPAAHNNIQYIIISH